MNKRQIDIYLFSDKSAKPFTAIKVNKSVKLLLTQNDLDEQWIFTGLCHSHPKYSKFPIANGKSDYKTPFEVNMPNPMEHITVHVERTDVTIHGVLVLLNKENHINLGYTINSTCPTSKFFHRQYTAKFCKSLFFRSRSQKRGERVVPNCSSPHTKKSPRPYQKSHPNY